MAKLTKRFVDAVQPTGRDVVLWDDELLGFGLRMKPSGAMAWVVMYRNREGRARKMTLAKLGRLTPEEARKEARGVLADVAKGGDPAEARAEARRDPTISELAELYLVEGPAAKPTKKQSSWMADASNTRRHIVPLLGRKHLRALTRADVERFQRDVTNGKTAADERTRPRGRAIVEGGPGTAARATAVLGAILNFAVSRGLRPDNPARGVKLNRGRNVERFLSAAELARLGDALVDAERQGANRGMVEAVRLLLLTGARRNEILGLCWEWIDFERGCLRLPDSKTGAKIVPLGAPALEILARLPRREGSSWVFPGAKGTGYSVGLPRFWRRIVRAASLPGLRIHDLRHGFASVAVADGSSLYILGKVLGHTQARTTEKYAHLDADPIRAVADRTARKIAAAMKGGDGGTVVPIAGVAK
jgi:integrase